MFSKVMGNTVWERAVGRGDMLSSVGGRLKPFEKPMPGSPSCHAHRHVTHRLNGTLEPHHSGMHYKAKANRRARWQKWADEFLIIVFVIFILQ